MNKLHQLSIIKKIGLILLFFFALIGTFYIVYPYVSLADAKNYDKNFLIGSSFLNEHRYFKFEPDSKCIYKTTDESGILNSTLINYSLNSDGIINLTYDNNSIGKLIIYSSESLYSVNENYFVYRYNEELQNV